MTGRKGDKSNHRGGIGTYDFAVVRYDDEGEDDSFGGGDGIVITSLSSSFEAAYAVAIASQDRIVVAGVAYNVGTGYGFAVVRYDDEGNLDTSFSGDGKVTTAAGTSGNACGRGVAIDSENRIVVAGYASNGGTYDFGVVRLGGTGKVCHWLGQCRVRPTGRRAFPARRA